jgi:predicted nucleic acid-binding protein
MTMTDGNAVFVDANILVYATFDHFPWYAAARDRVGALAAAPASLYTSRQVMREFLAVTTRPGFMAPMPTIAFLTVAVQGFESRFEILEDDHTVTALLLELINKPGARGRQVHDANIVATMRHYGIPNLLTHNTSDFARYQPWITVLPLIA